MDQFPIYRWEIFISGLSLSQIVEKVGQTPFYIYDKRVIAHRIGELRRNLPSEINIHYAIKANPMPELVQYISSLVDGFDVASKKETELALGTNSTANKISISGPGKSIEELEYAIINDIIVNIESITEFNRIIDIAETIGKSPSITVRVNPDFEIKSTGMKMGGGSSPFGIDAEKIPAFIKMLNNYNVNFKGFHIFWGSQNLNTEIIMETHRQIFQLVNKLLDECEQPINYLNIGGGFGIPYFPREKRLDIRPIGQNLSELITKYKNLLTNTSIVMELGRFIVGEAGAYVCEVKDIKNSRGTKYLITNGGLHHHLAATGNFGQVLRKNYPIAISHPGHINLNKNLNNKFELVNITGPLCTPLDVLGHKVRLPQAHIGDHIVIFQSGAYGLTASPVNFLSHPECKEILI